MLDTTEKKIDELKIGYQKNFNWNMETRKHEKYEKVPKRHVGYSEIHICKPIPRRGEIKAVFGDRMNIWRNTNREISKTDERWNKTESRSSAFPKQDKYKEKQT